ncbi:hypothetical protein [Actinomadura roseirufa]|uniref:hypothetical protein n=1 Tax=Actinomadura roseirufa TaxID=2094049 RepID=UPI00104128D1|nr:hypothetical protein [Actinomadura roseirufa]
MKRQSSGGAAAAASLPGIAVLESFAGATWEARWAAALSYAAAQTYKPTIVLPNGEITLGGGPYRLFDGLRVSGPVGAGEREFTTRGPSCVVTVTGKPLFAMPGGDVSNLWFKGVQFRAKTRLDWMVRTTDFGGGPIMKDADFHSLGWVGFSSVMHARHLRVSIQDMYCNNGSDVQFRLAGSDNFYWTQGRNYLSGSVPPTAAAYVYFTSMSRTRVGALYVTPQGASAFRIDGGYGGLSFEGTLLDSTGRTKDTACQGAALYIHSGEGHTFTNLWFFNNCTNPGATGRAGEKGQVFIGGGADEIVFSGCQWSGGAKQPVATPRGTPAIYAQSGVANVRVTDPLAPNGGEKRLQQAAAGTFSCNDPEWKIVTGG